MTDKKGCLGPYPLNSRHADKVTIDEIVKLRAENEQLREALRLMPKTIVDAADEIERLRHELERIADVSERWPDNLVSQINEIARAALKVSLSSN